MTIVLNTLDEVTSTNDVARDALLAGAASGTAFRARRQTQGRGRHGRSWVSEPGNLMMSVVLRPQLPDDAASMITLAAAVAAWDVLAALGLECGLKWPNDLRLGGRKLGGILTEGVVDGGKLVGCVVGIGINVGLEPESLDGALANEVTSFVHAERRAPDLDSLARELATALLAELARLEAGDSAAVLRRWKARNVTLGHIVELDQGGELKRGRAADLDVDGALLVERPDGGVITVRSGEVRFARTRSDVESDAATSTNRSKDLLLVLDVGNTNTVAGVFDGDRLISHWRLQTHPNISADEHGIALRQLLAAAELSPGDVAYAMLSCVVPPMVSILEDAVSRYFGATALIVGPGIRTGMPILTENPREVGADRVVNAVAAYERHPRGLIVVDFGTATTFDAVSPQGEYLGGAIAPGMAISADALFRRAAKLPRVDLTRPARVVGRNTVTSMQAGLIFGYIGLVKEIVLRMREELSFATRVLATGGLARRIAPETGVIDEVDDQLTLDGLRILFERNRDSLA